MSKNPERGTETPAADGPKAAQPAPWDAQLQPLEEFRERADSWMKEITAQVARLAGRSEDEERGKKALDKRLADIEERMQSLLTLTEMVSLSKNPFAAPPQEAPANPSPATARPPTPEAATPTAEPPQETAPTTEAAAAPVPAPAPAPAPMAAAGPPARSSGTPPSLALSDEDAPAITARHPSPTHRPLHRAHPNDAGADPISVHRAATRPFEPPATTARAPRASGPDGDARSRFLILEWAALIAPSAHRIDLGAFLGFYVESGWIDPSIAGVVRNLTLQLRHHGTNSTAKAPSLEELHARSIVLVSQLDGEDAPLDQAQTAFAEARAAASGAWITAKT